MSLADVPDYFADFFDISVVTAQLLLSLIVICAIVLPFMIMAKGKNAVTIWLIMVFVGQLIVVGLGWLPFWVLIMTITVVALSMSVKWSEAISG